ncbi:MAG: hypothetical protein GEU93_04040 [Propionibacteriales bacterium]|nr:hypothetical protein [Propionibacteriales bacterium]
MSRRVSLPGADELFRRTSETPQPHPLEPVPDAPPDPEPVPEPEGRAPAERARLARVRPDRTSSGRVKHDEKMTVYITADELLEIEHARLVLRRSLGSAVDRGRLVRAAVAMALADLDEHGADSQLVRRLDGS